jgi:hypothetical protein
MLHINSLASHLVPAGGGVLVLVVSALASLLIFGLLVIWLLNLRSGVVSLSARVSKREEAISQLASEQQAHALLVRQMANDLEELRGRLEEQAAASQAAALWAASGAPINLNRRGQILRLSRKGMSVAEIARDLNVAQGEVELMLKVHDLGQQDLSNEK